MSLPKGNLNKPTGALINLMNQLNKFTDFVKENELKLPNCKYREIYYFLMLFQNFHFSTSMYVHLPKTLTFFKILLNDLNVNFDILAITETQIKKNSSNPINLQLDDYSIEHCYPN